MQRESELGDAEPALDFDTGLAGARPLTEACTSAASAGSRSANSGPMTPSSPAVLDHTEVHEPSR
jgi:hypothetical protein